MQQSVGYPHIDANLRPQSGLPAEASCNRKKSTANNGKSVQVPCNCTDRFYSNFRQLSTHSRAHIHTLTKITSYKVNCMLLQSELITRAHVRVVCLIILYMRWLVSNCIDEIVISYQTLETASNIVKEYIVTNDTVYEVDYFYKHVLVPRLHVIALIPRWGYGGRCWGKRFSHKLHISLCRSIRLCW